MMHPACAGVMERTWGGTPTCSNAPEKNRLANWTTQHSCEHLAQMIDNTVISAVRAFIEKNVDRGAPLSLTETELASRCGIAAFKLRPALDRLKQRKIIDYSVTGLGLFIVAKKQCL